MKPFFTILLWLVCMVLPAQTPQYEWDYVSTLQNEWLQKICTQGLDTVYIVGRNGLIAQSTDRVLTWNKQYPVSTQLNDIIFCNHTTGFAVGNNGVILRTTDAGASWTQQNSGVTVNLNAIAATGTDNIWAVGDSGKVVYSTNAGVTWQKKDFSVLANLNDISFRNNTGYIVGNAHTCFFSSDKGSNWIFKDIALDNPYNEPVSIFDLFSINQTQNHACILIGYEKTGWSINIDNNTFIHTSTTVTNFTMKNDSIGYASSGNCTAGSNGTGSSSCSIAVQILNLNNIVPYSAYFIGVNNPSSYLDFDSNHSDMNFVNDSIGYLVSGSLLYQLKKYIPVIPDPNGLNNVTNKKLRIDNNSTRLTIQFEDTKVEKIELYSITGLKILSENVNANETSKSINITDLSKGTYIIRVYNRDNTSTNTKWIKQ
jgi:hypothetical protein